MILVFDRGSKKILYRIRGGCFQLAHFRIAIAINVPTEGCRSDTASLRIILEGKNGN